MSKVKWLALATALIAGCVQVDENPDWDPRQLPGWTYDAPFYCRPTEELKVIETISDETTGNTIPVYYSRSEYFFIRHPGGYQVTGVPRVAVWCSVGEEQTWKKQGYFGVEQSHFLFKAVRDGRHWIRFVGPGQGVTRVPPGVPHRIYVVDRQPPEIIVTVEPSPWKDEEETEHRIYQAGQEVALRWVVRDPHLARGTVRLQTCFARFPHNLVWSEFPTSLPARGEKAKVAIPPEAVGEGGIRFRIEARDKAGNVGMGLTDVLLVQGEGVATTQPAVRPAGDFELIQQTGGAAGERLGWPMRGSMLYAGTSRLLGWMPKSAADYDTIELQFTANNGQTWRTMVEGAKPEQKIKWTVPAVTSKNCRLRIVGVMEKTAERVMLAMTQRFTVQAIPPDTILGPQKIEDERGKEE